MPADIKTVESGCVGKGGPDAHVRDRRRSSGLLGGAPIVVPVLGLGIVLVVVVVLSVGVGAVTIDPAHVMRAIIDGLLGRSGTGVDFIVWQLRVPRVVEALLVGAGLAVAGAVVQVLVQNPLAEPFTLGLSSGASLGAVLVITSAATGSLIGAGLPVAAFLGALGSGGAVFILATSARGMSAARLVMVGVALSHLLSALTSFVLLRGGDSDAAQQVMYWILGSLSGATWPLVCLVAPVVLICLIVLRVCSRRLDILSLGDASASALGIHPGRSRLLLFVVAAVLTGAVVAVSGTVGFVGLVVPNVARMLVGGRHARLLPITALLGALLLLLSDTGARTLLAPSEMPIGILTAVVGVPGFVFVLRRQAEVR